MRQKHAFPTRKVGVGIVTDAACLLVVMIANQYWLADNPIPAEAGMLAATVIGGIASWLVPPAKEDQIEPA